MIRVLIYREVTLAKTRSVFFDGSGARIDAAAGSGAGKGGPGGARRAIAQNQRHQRDCHTTRRRPAGGGQDHHRSGRALRLWLRHLHAARRPGDSRGGEISQAVPGGQTRRPHRRHLAGLLQQLILAQRPGAQQCHQRRGRGVVGHQRQAGRDARVSTAGRQDAGGVRHLHQRERQRDGAGDRQRPQGHGERLPSRAAADRCTRHGGIRSGRRHGRPSAGAARSAGVRAAPVHPPRGEDAARCAQGAGRRRGTAARHARARDAAAGRAVRQRCGGREAVLPGGLALARGHRVLPPDSRSNATRRWQWANCSTARTSGRRC